MNILRLQLKVWWANLVLRVGAAHMAWKEPKIVIDDMRRYRKLRDLMSCNVLATWERTEHIASVGAWMSWDDFDSYLDATDVRMLHERGYDLSSSEDLRRSQTIDGTIKAHEPLKLNIHG